MPKAFCMISGFCQQRLALFSSLEMAAGYNWMFADSWVRVLENSLRKVQNTGKRSLSYRITLAIIFTFIPAYHWQDRFFAYLLIFTGCGKLFIICRLRGLLTNKRKANHQAHWSVILLLKKRYYWAMCHILLVFNDHCTLTAAVGFAGHKKVSEWFFFFM